ncbi:MmcQ/YjbR family DNA-binding protein [Neisseria chenwenguii]|uniref:MmcQ protein n=1 Tax=Neisseria chenwenguii TaxID=1853278 RepID=A0A220RYY8_9NEIS|nr:MmcQ/YjbR family DNA-binding protein [Neisseria chenwenguii]ASK26421.1 MmcQ protein [Neisseria chenwenguii]ROV55844.1 MmcQ protein [Neisseria chenwenguii]
MNQAALFSGIAERYGAEPQYLWAKYPDYAVFRHAGGKRKWFAVYLPVPAEKIGRKGGAVPLLNLKCPPETVGALRQMRGFLSAYHMNKEHWVSAVLGEADDELIWPLIAESRRLTEK